MRVWSTPVRGMTHAGDLAKSTWWVTVTDYGTFATLLRWFPGCRFYPTSSVHDTVAQAKAVGEKWLDEHEETK